jgi:phosphoribosylaminoimidazole-succinocarboxamide synthase
MKTMHSQVLRETNLPGIQLFSRGKVRDVYQVEDDLLIVATDRISAFDVILNEGIPDKGYVLTELSRFWLRLLADIVPNHMKTTEWDEYPAIFHPFRDQLEGRSMLVRRAKALPIECVARGFLAGSGWKEYKAQGAVCGIRLPAGLRESDSLPEPIFTPATKAQSGHDENIPFEAAADRVGRETAEKLREFTLEIYRRGRDYAEQRNLILADTKFEFGWADGELILIDEVLTPDSSRFWPKNGYQPGRPQPSFDKQFVRDYLESLHWNKQPPPPSLPSHIVEQTAEKYRESLRLLTQ